jgi:hypothetical protein
MSKALVGFGVLVFLSAGQALVPLILLFLGLIYSHHRAVPIGGQKYWILSVLPLMWVFVGFWGSHFWRAPQADLAGSNPPWVPYVIGASVLIFVLYGLVMIAYFRGARWFATLYFSFNLYFMLSLSFFSSMAVIGEDF